MRAAPPSRAVAGSPRNAAAPSRAERFLARALSAVLRVCSATWRGTVIGGERLEAHAAGGTRFLVAFWHGDYLPLFTQLRGRRACIVTTRSCRGRVLAGLGACFGHHAVQIPEGGEPALAALHAALAQEPLAGLAVDGPHGPYHLVKRGVIQLASELGLAVLPVATHARWKIQLWRWDRMTIPLPFTRIALVLGQPLAVPAGLGPEEVPIWAERLARDLAELDREARRAATGAV